MAKKPKNPYTNPLTQGRNAQGRYIPRGQQPESEGPSADDIRAMRGAQELEKYRLDMAEAIAKAHKKDQDAQKERQQKLEDDALKAAKKLEKEQQRAETRRSREAARAQRELTRVQNKAQRDSDRAQEKSQRAATKAQKQIDKDHNQSLLNQYRNSQNLYKASIAGAAAQQRALGGIASSVQATIDQRAKKLASTGGPAGRRKAAMLQNVTGPAMIKAAQQAYLAQPATATVGGSLLGAGRKQASGSVLGASAGIVAPRTGPPPPAPRPSLLSRGVARFERGVDGAIGLRNDLHEVSQGSALDKLSLALKGNTKLVAASAAASAATAMLGHTVGGTVSIIGALKTAFMATWDYLDTKVLPTTSMLNRAFGATTPGMKQLRQETMSTALQFERLGLGFEKGAQTAKDIATGFRQVNIPPELLSSLVKVSEYAGVGGDQSGRLARSFLSTGTMTKDLGKTIDNVMMDSRQAAEEFLVPVNMVRNEFASNIDLLQRWGTNNTQQFNRAIAKAQSYGLSLRQVEGVFGKSMDTFETTSDVASKVNAAFGTNLDSIQLLQQKSVDRMETIRNAVLNTGFEWTTASQIAKNLLMTTVGISDEEEAAGIFGSQKQRASAKERVKSQKAIADGMMEWKRALSSLGTQLTSVEQLSRNFFMAIGNVVAKLLGFESGIDATKTGVKTFERFMDNLTGKINDFAKAMPTNENGIGPAVISWLKDFSTSLGSARDLVRDIRNYFDDLYTIGEGDASGVANQFEDLFRKGGTPAEFAASQARLMQSSFLHPKQSMKAYEKIQRDLGFSRDQVGDYLNKPLDMEANQNIQQASILKALGPGPWDPTKNMEVTLIIDGSSLKMPILGGAVKQGVTGRSDSAPGVQ